MGRYLLSMILALSAFAGAQDASAMPEAERAERKAFAEREAFKEFCLGTMMVDHGYWTRAQFQCENPEFREYSPKILETARECSRAIGQKAAGDAAKKGIMKFDDLAKAIGHEEACAFMIQRYPRVYMLK